MQIWTSNVKGDDKIIAYFNSKIYKANPKDAEVENYIFDLKTNKEAAKGFFTIPVRYISEINMQQGKNYLEVIFRGDSEYLKIHDSNKKNEIFNFFRDNISGAIVANVNESKLKSGKKPLIALGVILIIFLWSLYIAIDLEHGNEYDVTGERYHSIAGVILILANLGVTKLCLIFGSLFLITLYTLIRKVKNPLSKRVLLFQK